MTPAPLKLTPEENAALQMLFSRVGQIAIEKQGWGKTCLACCHFNEKTETCAKWDARPPARTIVEACPAFQADPF